MLGAAGYCVYQAVQQSGESLIMAQIVVSLVSTCKFPPNISFTLRNSSCSDEIRFRILADGCYVLSSLIAGDPWVRESFSLILSLSECLN
jgi:chitin synthase